MQNQNNIYSCGCCGAPCTEQGELLDFPTDDYNVYNPNDYEHTWCRNCWREENRVVVTREMALDAGDLSLEGQLI